MVQARAQDYVFKPHGVANDIDTIIMSRKQYRTLLPNGERNAAFEALKVLLLTRPVVYMGFGLRDLDFLLLQDYILNTFGDSPRDHYAIMADLSDTDREYWQQQYGISIVSYNTTPGPNGRRDHANLLSLLYEMSTDLDEDELVGLDPKDPGTILALVRLAGRLMQGETLDDELHLYVLPEQTAQHHSHGLEWVDGIDQSPVESFLDAGPDMSLVTGPPGAGKTYAIHRSASRLAKELNEACLAETFEPNSIVVPILADLKMYQGNLLELLNDSLPAGLSFETLSKVFNVKIYLDSFNEMSQKHLESGVAESDFSEFIANLGKASIVIASRTSDGLEKMGLSTHSLDCIDERDVSLELERVNVSVTGTFAREMMSLLQRPFFLRQITSGVIQLPTEAHPRDFYSALLKNINSAFAERFSTEIEIGNVLAHVAYDAMNRGEEAFPLEKFVRVFRSIGANDMSGIDAIEVANWLVSRSILIPYSRGRIAFAHQSVTDFLAASELARKYEANPHLLKQKLANRRWDQALSLCIGLVPANAEESFLDDLIEADFILGLKAVKYAVVGRDSLVSKLLSEIPDQVQQRNSMGMEIEGAFTYDLPISEAHAAQLRELITFGGTIGAVSVLQLAKLKGSAVKDELLHLMVENCADYNLCRNGVGPALKSFAVQSDVNKIGMWADSIEAGLGIDAQHEDTDGFIDGAAEFLSELDLAVVQQNLLRQDTGATNSEFRSEILFRILDEQHSQAGLDLAREMLHRGISEAAGSIHHIGRFSMRRDELSWVAFSSDHVQILVSMMDEGVSSALEALEEICSTRFDLSEIVTDIASASTGIRRAALMYCVSPEDHEPVLKALEGLTKMSDSEIERQPIHLLRNIEYNWTGQERLFVDLLRVRNATLANAMFGGSIPPMITGLGKLDIGPIDWWLEWILEEWAKDEDTFLTYQLGRLFAEHLNTEVHTKFIGEFNKPSTRFRSVLLHFVIPQLPNLSTDSFSEYAISSLLDDLDSGTQPLDEDWSVLGKTATERFATQYLVPLLSTANEPCIRKLQSTLRQAGLRHGRRYIVNVP